MIFGFDTNNRDAATAALLVYAVYRSRDIGRFEIRFDMWDRIERAIKNAAKRAKTLPEFLEALKPRLACGALKPRWLEIGANGTVPMIAIHNEGGGVKEFIQPAADPDAREFLTGIFEEANARAVIRKLYRETTWISALVRNRLESEKPIESMIDKLRTSETGYVDPTHLMSLRTTDA